MSFLRGFLTALIGSVVLNLVLLFVLRPLVIDLAMPLHALAVMPVAMLTTIGVVGAVVVYAVMRALMTNPNKVFIMLSGIVLVLSFIPDVLIIGKTTGPFAGGTLASALVLMLMHVAAALVSVYALTRMWGPRAAA